MRICVFGGHDPTYPRGVIIRKGLRDQGVEVVECILRSRRKFWLRYPFLLCRYLKNGRGAPILFVPEFRQKDVPLAKMLALVGAKRLIFDPLAARYETKILDWRRRPPGSWQARWNRTLDRLAFKLSDLILVDTASHGEYFRRFYGVAWEKMAVLPVGYDEEFFSPFRDEEERKSGFTVLFAGSFLPLHGVENIIRAAAVVFRRDPAVRFVFVGSGQTQGRAVRLSKELGLDNVSFEGWSDLEDLPRRIAQADLCLGIFGRTEKAQRVVPHKVFQAMGMGKPVVTARTPAAEEFFVHGENIYLCDSPCEESLAAAVLDLRRDREKRRKIAEQGLKLARENFSSKALGRRLLSILEERRMVGEALRPR